MRRANFSRSFFTPTLANSTVALASSPAPVSATTLASSGSAGAPPAIPRGSILRQGEAPCGRETGCARPPLVSAESRRRQLPPLAQKLLARARRERIDGRLRSARLRDLRLRFGTKLRGDGLAVLPPRRLLRPEVVVPGPVARRGSAEVVATPATVESPPRRQDCRPAASDSVGRCR